MTRRVPRAPKVATMPTMDAQTARRVDAEIAKLMMEAEKFGEERRKLTEEGHKLRAETAKMARETFLYPVFICAGLMGAGAALFGALSKVFP